MFDDMIEISRGRANFSNNNTWSLKITTVKFYRSRKKNLLDQKVPNIQDWWHAPAGPRTELTIKGVYVINYSWYGQIIDPVCKYFDQPIFWKENTSFWVLIFNLVSLTDP